MQLEIVYLCTSSVIGCIKGTFASLYSFIIILVCMYILYKLVHQNEKSCIFELIPISFTIIQGSMMFILNFFIMDIKFLIVGLYFQALNFGIVTLSCQQLYMRLQCPKQQEFYKKATYILFAIFTLISFLFLILTLSDVFILSCFDWLSFTHLFPVSMMIFFTIFQIYYGHSLIKAIQTTKNDQQNAIQCDQVNLDNTICSRDSQFIQQTKKQLKIIIYTFIFSIILQILMDALRTYVLSNIVCIVEQNEQSQKYTATDSSGYVFLLFCQFVYITPCLIAPYVFYYIPQLDQAKGRSLSFNMAEKRAFSVFNGDNAYLCNNDLLKKYLLEKYNTNSSSEIKNYQSQKTEKTIQNQSFQQKQNTSSTQNCKKSKFLNTEECKKSVLNQNGQSINSENSDQTSQQ